MLDDYKAAPKAAFGISGLDDVLAGGLQRDSAFLLEGSPGTGKTTFARALCNSLQVPLVVRMKGTNEELGKKMLAESGLPIIAADTMAEAATKIVAAVK